MKIENIEVYGFSSSFRGMRNPLESWDKSDSRFNTHWENDEGSWPNTFGTIMALDCAEIGPNDLKLALKLIKGGSEHRKFLRQIQIWVDLTLPIYIWAELDTYKVATVRDSCSTMHKLGSRDLTQEDFELPIPESYLSLLNLMGTEMRALALIKESKRVNDIRREYKNALPCGYLLKSTYTMNYETAMSMYFQRRTHRLPEWREDNPNSICSFIKALPYMKEFINAAEK